MHRIQDYTIVKKERLIRQNVLKAIVIGIRVFTKESAGWKIHMTNTLGSNHKKERIGVLQTSGKGVTTGKRRISKKGGV